MRKRIFTKVVAAVAMSSLLVSLVPTASKAASINVSTEDPYKQRFKN